MKERIPDQPIQEIVLSVLNESIIKKKGKYCLVSKKTDRNLGCYRSKKGAKKREKQVQYFKYLKEVSGMASGAAAIGTKQIGEEDNDRN